MNRRKAGHHKRRARGYIFPTPMAVILVCVAAASFGYLWLDARVKVLGKEIKHLEQEWNAARRARVNEEYRWERILSPGQIEGLLRRHGLEMSLPDARRIVQVYITEPLPAREGAGSMRVARHD